LRARSVATEGVVLMAAKEWRGGGVEGSRWRTGRAEAEVRNRKPETGNPRGPETGDRKSSV
jgi:hypothetical protein